MAAFIGNWVGSTIFKADVTFDELVRTMGLAYVWHIVGVLGVLSAFSPALDCLVFPAAIVAWIWGFIAWLVAVKEALDLEWVQTIVTVFLAWIVNVVFYMVFGGIVLGLLGLGAFAFGRLIG